MRPLDVYSEPYGATGNIGENFRRLLGAPSIDPFQTVIREAVQNIADAAKLGTGPEVLIRLRTLDGPQRDTLRSVVLHDLPIDPSSKDSIEKALAQQELAVLEICDFNTIGLGGPTRADRMPVGTNRTDFIEFLRNIGTPRDTDHGGGTYGFGKVSLYRASRCSTIIVDSVPHDCDCQRRLIGCHVGRSFERSEGGMLRKYTGRHWWGVSDPEDSVVDPLTGNQAGEVANALGLPERNKGRSGTSIMILDFDLEGEGVESAAKRVVESLLWNFWPRMMRDAPESRRFNCRVEANGLPVRVPDPEELSPLDLFCKAMRAARSGSGNDVRSVEAYRPRKFLGTVAVEKSLKSDRRPLVSNDSLMPKTLHHIALMRPVELVVKYLEGSPLPDERLEWAGVFIASDDNDVESAFAESEPPAHDDWIPNNLAKGHARTYVNVALTRLDRIAAEMGESPLRDSTNPGSGPPLARAASTLGAVLENVGGDGAGRPGPGRKARGSVRPRRAKISRPEFDRLELSDRGRVAVFQMEVEQDEKSTGAAVVASAWIAIDGGGAVNVDGKDERPSVISISSRDRSLYSEGDVLPLDGQSGRFEVRVLVPKTCAVKVDARLLTEGFE